MKGTSCEAMCTRALKKPLHECAWAMEKFDDILAPTVRGRVVTLSFFYSVQRQGLRDVFGTSQKIGGTQMITER